MIDINLSGVRYTAKAAVPHVLSGKSGGSIVLTSSVGGRKAYPNTGYYIAAKHGVIGLMRAFAAPLINLATSQAFRFPSTRAACSNNQQPTMEMTNA